MENVIFDSSHHDIMLGIPLFRDLGAHVKSKLREVLECSVYAISRNEVAIEQGQPCRSLYILLEGCLEVNIIDSNGNEVLIEHIVAPRAFATPHLFKDDNRFPATFVAKEDSLLLTASKESAFRLISEYPEVLRSFLRVSGNCDACTTKRLDVLSRKTIRERLAVYLLKKVVKGTSLVKLPHTLTQMAEYMNVSRPALSTEFNKMEKEGILRRLEKDCIEVNVGLLQEIL